MRACRDATLLCDAMPGRLITSGKAHTLVRVRHESPHQVAAQRSWYDGMCASVPCCGVGAERGCCAGRVAYLSAMATFSRHAVAVWTGDVARGTGTVTAGTDAFAVSMTFPRLAGEPPNTTTPEELLAASHANCYAIALRSVLGQRRGAAQRVTVTATVTAEKGMRAIRILSSHLEAIVEGLEGIAPEQLNEIAHAAERECTISSAIRGAVPITVNVAAS